MQSVKAMRQLGHPQKIAALDMIHPFRSALFNTIILLLSGTTVTQVENDP